MFPHNTIISSTYIYKLYQKTLPHENQCITPPNEVDLFFNNQSLTSTYRTVKHTLPLDTSTPLKYHLCKKHKNAPPS